MCFILFKFLCAQIKIHKTYNSSYSFITPVYGVCIAGNAWKSAGYFAGEFSLFAGENKNFEGDFKEFE